jgi:Mce-associated membrane protein
MTGRIAQLSRRRHGPAKREGAAKGTADAAGDGTDDVAGDATENKAADAETEAHADDVDVAAADDADDADDADGTDDAAAAAPTAAARRRARRGTRRARPARPSAGTQILVLLALVAVVLAIAVVSLRDRGNELSAADSGAQKAMFAAATAAQDLSSYDYRTLESDIKTAAGQTTGQLRTDYEKQAQAIMATARQQQVVVNAQTVKSGVVSASAGEVVILVFLNRTTSKTAGSTAGQERTPDQLRLLMTMKKAGDRWLVAQVDVM